jgi:hypothetical protein
MDQEKLVTRPQLAEFLSERGFPISYSTLTTYCSPAVNIGPPVEVYWGARPMHSPVRALEWAKARLRRAESAGCGKAMSNPRRPKVIAADHQRTEKTED